MKIWEMEKRTMQAIDAVYDGVESGEMTLRDLIKYKFNRVDVVDGYVDEEHRGWGWEYWQFTKEQLDSVIVSADMDKDLDGYTYWTVKLGGKKNDL